MGKKIVVELTNRCNLHCCHCFSGRHGGHTDLPLTVLDQLLAEAHLYGFDELSFTGGDPTVYRYFPEALQRTAKAGYRFALNTNGWNFAQSYPKLLPYLEQLSIITFSLDGATAATHDQLRGIGSFRRVMQAMSICVVKAMPFSINMVITAHNRHEVATMSTLAARLGARGLRFGHLMPAPLTTTLKFDLSPQERDAVDGEIRVLAGGAPLPLVLAPGHKSADLFPCAPLQFNEININCAGEMTKCCHLSGHGAGVGQGDIVGNLAEIAFGEAYQRLCTENEQFRRAKERHFQGPITAGDHYPCWYCSRYYQKVDWLQEKVDHPWQSLLQ
ncbi:MAG: radical SAM protein [Caldilineaceae bacterium]